MALLLVDRKISNSRTDL